MKRIGLMIGFLALLIVMLPSLPAQDAKKDDAKKEEPKKEEAKKDEPKKDEPKKDDEKKPETKKAEKEKLSYGVVWQGVKIVRTNGESSDLTIEVKELDPKKVYETNVWAAQRQAQLSQDLFNAQKQKGQGYQQAMFNYNKSVATFQLDMVKRQAGNYSPKNIEVKPAENAKVRVLVLPQEFDDAGAVKKWTRKEIEARKDKTGLPGFPADFDAIKAGQYIDIYLAKQAPPAKAQPKKKAADDDEAPAVKTRQEYVMIVIRAEPMQK